MGKTVEKKRKKKGRPSLLDLQKRSLRLQKQQQHQQQNPNHSPNPYLRFPSSSTPSRRTARRNPNPDDEEEDEESSGKRREKKLKFVLRLPTNNRSADSQRNTSDSDSSRSESNGDEETPLKKRKIDAVSCDGSARKKTESHNSASKATVPLQGEPSDSGPTTPLPDKKLLVFILDRLQKKDTYGVFSEPVDPNELPDYHEVIEHPMDFGTVRKRLSCGYYANLEQFEKEVFLICSNAMRYNAPDTIYFRQARSIQELAKKNFENLRQESDENEPEPKTVRRGRPPSKNTINKRTVGRLPAERASSDFSSDATLANAGDNTLWSNASLDLTRRVSASGKPGTADVSTRATHGLRNSESCSWVAEHKPERNEECSGSMKGIPMRFGKKVSVLDENRRNTYKQPESSTCGREPCILTTFDGEKKQLVPVGLHMEHSYARSLARFAANLGPVGWEIAAKQIEKVLPPGTKFGRGWVGERDAPQSNQPPLLSSSPQHPSSQPKTSLPITISKGDTKPERLEPSPSSMSVQEGHLSRSLSPSASSSAVLNRSSSNPVEGTEPARGSNCEGGFSTQGGGGMRPKAPFQLHQNMPIQPGINGGGGMRPKAPFQLRQNMPPIQPGVNGFNTAFAVGEMVNSARPTGNFVSETLMTTHARAPDMVSRSSNNSFIHPAPTSHLEGERPKSSNSSAVNSVSHMPNSTRRRLQESWRGSSSLHPKPDSTPPDLNVRFQSPGSPATGVVMVDSQHPDLALQL